MFDTIRSVPKPLSAVLAVLALALVWTVDLFSGFDVTMSFFYALPVIFAVWAVSRGYGVAMAVLAVCFWTSADFFSGHHFATHWILVWNSGMRFCYLMLVVMGAYFARRELDHTRARTEALEKALPVCHCCKRIADEHGAWVEVETYLSEHLPSRPESKLCPDCSKRVYIQKVSPDLPSTHST